MCGIVGLITKPSADFISDISIMRDSLKHRGPDAYDSWICNNNGVALAHRRLSIIDLSDAGKQPIESHNNQYVMTFNGEIYNHLELRKKLERSWKGRSDSETLLEAISEWGIEKTLQECVGMFAFGVWDKKNKSLVLARDRFGEKPLYYGLHNKNFIFASELKAFKEFSGFNPSIDRDSLKSFTRFSYIPAPNTIYHGIKKLMPGSYLRINAPDLDTLPIQKVYWSSLEEATHAINNKYTGTFQSACNHLEDLLVQSVSRQSISDVPIGSFLSGGIDSSLITAIYQSISDRPINTFSIGYEEESYNEAPFARKVAKFLNTNHTELILSPDDILSIIPKLGSIYDEPFSDSSQIPTLLVSKLARESVTVALSGDGGDELFGGYNRYLYLNRLRYVPKYLQQRFASIIRTQSPEKWDKIFSILTLKQSKFKMFGDKLHKLAELFSHQESRESFLRSLSSIDNTDVLIAGNQEDNHITKIWNEIDHSFSDVEKMMIIDTVTYLPDDILCKVDRASMYHSLETRAPFLDHNVFKFAWELDHSNKVNKSGGKLILKEILSKYLPIEMFERPKMGFGIPVGYWIKDSLHDWAYEMLEPIFHDQDEFFSSNTTNRIWREHQSGLRNWGQLLWGIIIYSSWRKSSQT